MSEPHEKFVIGLVGQVCAGKSAVAAAFQRLGAQVYDADKAVKELYTRPDVKAEVRALLGDEVFDENGNVVCKTIGKIVFSERDKLKALTEKIIYPRTAVIIQDMLEAFKKSDAQALVLDAPTLFEAKREHLCDNIVYVAAPRERREEWARLRGWERGELERREAKLSNDEAKRKRADAIINNSGPLAEIDRQVDRLMSLWTMK